MKRFLLLPTLVVACCLPALQASAQTPKTFYTELKLYQADRLKMTVSMWKSGDLVRREYETTLHQSYITTPKGTYVIVNRADRGVRLNNDSPALEGKLVEQYATWPMEDVEKFLEDWKAKLIGKTEIKVEGKTYKALKYNYTLKDGKTVASLWIEEATRRPLRVQWGQNKNTNVPLSQVKDPSTIEYQTRIDFVKYAKGQPVSADLFKPPTTVVDMGDGKKLLGPRNRAPGATDEAPTGTGEKP
ncbi:MAG: hypothetical protein HRF45_07800 [Fimbriimonadia bacterium]|jgi:CYTH domain-containing protein